MKGYSLLELLLVISIIIIIAAVISPFFFGSKISTEIEEEAKKIASVLKISQSKSMTGENSLNWGVYFSNITSTEPLYDVFQGANYASGTTTDRYYLSSAIIYQSPVAGASTEIVFNKRSGNLTGNASATITIKSISPEIIKNIIIYPNGRINVQ